jgi:hypothetical protein
MPGRPVYIIHTTDRAVLLGAEDLTGPLRDFGEHNPQPATQRNGEPPVWPVPSD